MTGLPALEAGEGIPLALGPRDLDQRVLGGAGTRRLHSGRLARLLAKMRRPRRVAQSLPFLARGELEQPLERAGRLIDARVTVAHGGEPLRHRGERKLR